ncbi:MAG: hypothetical protein QXU98_09800 [Candidatus Parvarchaeota archaeon]
MLRVKDIEYYDYSIGLTANVKIEPNRSNLDHFFFVKTSGG